MEADLNPGLSSLSHQKPAPFLLYHMFPLLGRSTCGSLLSHLHPHFSHSAKFSQYFRKCHFFFNHLLISLGGLFSCYLFLSDKKFLWAPVDCKDSSDADHVPATYGLCTSCSLCLRCFSPCPVPYLSLFIL